MKSTNLLLAGLLVLGLASCKGKSTETQADSTATQQVVTEQAPAADSTKAVDSTKAAVDTTKKEVKK